MAEEPMADRPESMAERFDTLAERNELAEDAASALHERGFVVLPAALPADRLARLTDAYTSAMAEASGDDLRIGSTSTRLTDMVNRGAEFDPLYVHPLLLDACRRVIGKPFKISSLMARTLRPGAGPQELHVDVPRGSADWPLVGFIWMIDDFRPDNGATRFVPGSQRRTETPAEAMPDPYAPCDGEVLACGAAGSLLVFDGSAWHGHTANVSSGPRRSIQGAFIPRDGRAATDFRGRMHPETRARIGALARDVLGLEDADRT